MNFRGVRDFTEDKQRYEKVLQYLLNIQNSYPDLYQELLLGTPQLEYEMENCRTSARYARYYRLVLEHLVLSYQQERSGPTQANVLKEWVSATG